jgi:thiamine biosynthesis lipoprotein ApbE
MRRKFVSKGKVVSVDLPSMRDAEQLLDEVGEALESGDTEVTSAAIEQAAARIRSEHVEDFSIDSGDEVLVGSADDATAVWTVDIPDPVDQDESLFSVDLVGSRNAVSTDTGSFNQITVVADDLATASEAVAAIAESGTDDLDEVAERFDVDVIAVDQDGTVEASPGFDAVLSGETVDELRERTGR